MEENYFTPQEMAKKFKVTDKAILKWIREGKLKAVKLGGVWRIPESALEQFIKESTVSGEGE